MIARCEPAFESGTVQSFLAFDYGTRRVGVAVGNTLLRQGQPLQTLAVVGPSRLIAIDALVRDWRPDALVVGVPLHPDGAPHENTARAQRFARQLHGRYRLPVHEVDERYSTTEAQSRAAGLGARLRAADADAGAAAIILDQYLGGLARDT